MGFYLLWSSHHEAWKVVKLFLVGMLLRNCFVMESVGLGLSLMNFCLFSFSNMIWLVGEKWKDLSCCGFFFPLVELWNIDMFDENPDCLGFIVQTSTCSNFRLWRRVSHWCWELFVRRGGWVSLERENMRHPCSLLFFFFFLPSICFHLKDLIPIWSAFFSLGGQQQRRKFWQLI